MARFSTETVEQVRAAADMVEIVSAHTDLRRQGARWTGLCPFHEERTPSFSVHAEEKLYHCFGCGVGGDLFDFVAEKEGLEFPDAVESLAERYGVEVVRESEDPRAEARRKARARLFDLLKRSAAFYAAFFREAAEAGKARDYLAGRGLGTEVLTEFEVGYSPSAWDTILMRGQQAGFTVAELSAVGLVQKGRSGGSYERFRERITFPIRDARGRVVGFGARAMRDKQGAKYVNSAETDFFHKREILYGIDRARGPMAKAGRAVVVEGYTDVLALHQAGITETVGVMGTAITEQQIAQLSATVDRIVLALDADEAGQNAMLKAQRVAAGRDLRIEVAKMPPGVDPAEMLAGEGGADRFREAVEAAVDIAQFQVDLILSGAGGSPQERDRALGEAIPVLAQIPAGATRDELLRRVAERLGIEPSTVATRVSSGAASASPATDRDEPSSSSPGSGPGEATAGGLLSTRERRERTLLAMCLASPGEGRACLARIGPEHLSSDLNRRAAAWLEGHLEHPMEGLDPEDRELHGLLAELVVSAEREGVGEGAMRRAFLELELLALEDRIAEAARSGDAERRAELNRERSALRERVRTAEAEQGEQAGV